MARSWAFSVSFSHCVVLSQTIKQIKKGQKSIGRHRRRISFEQYWYTYMMPVSRSRRRSYTYTPPLHAWWPRYSPGLSYSVTIDTDPCGARRCFIVQTAVLCLVCSATSPVFSAAVRNTTPSLRTPFSNRSFSDAFPLCLVIIASTFGRFRSGFVPKTILGRSPPEH